MLRALALAALLACALIPAPAGAATSPALRSVSCAGELCVAVGDAGAISVSTDQGIHWQASSAPVTLDFKAVSCPDSSDCVAVAACPTGTSALLCPEPDVMRTKDGGQTWKPSFALASAQALVALDCVGTDCIAAGDSGAITTSHDLGLTWVPRTAIAGIPTSISCPTASVCFMTDLTSAGAEIRETTDFGRHWLVQQLSKASDAAVSCADARGCIAVSGRIAYSISGAGLHVRGLGYLSENAGSLSCPNPTTCTLVAASVTLPDCLDSCVPRVQPPDMVERTDDGGVTWSRQLMAQQHSLHAVTCPDAQTCIAVGDGGLVESTIDGGNPFHPSSIDSTGGPVVTALTCGGWAFALGWNVPCVGVGPGGTIVARGFTGGWEHEQSPTTSDLDHVACAVACVATASDGTVIAENLPVGPPPPPVGFYAPRDPQVSGWKTVDLHMASGVYAVGVACPGAYEAVECEVLDSAGTVHEWNFDSASQTYSWVSAALPQATAVNQSNVGDGTTISQLSCPYPACYAVTGSAFYQSSDGTSWQQVLGIPGGLQLTCGYTFCIVDDGNQEYRVDTSSWTMSTISVPEQISCWSTSCASTTQSAFFSVDQGQTWSESDAAVPGEVNGFATAIDCSWTCTAAFYDGTTVTFNPYALKSWFVRQAPS